MPIMPTPNIATPTEVIILVEKHSEVSIADCVEHTFYVNGQEYKRLPLDANVREPDVNKSKPYKDMINTLKKLLRTFLKTILECLW